MHHTTVLCCRGDVVQHRPGEQEGDGDGPRVAGGRPREHLQGEEGRTPPRLMDRSTIIERTKNPVHYVLVSRFCFALAATASRTCIVYQSMDGCIMRAVMACGEPAPSSWLLLLVRTCT